MMKKASILLFFLLICGMAISQESDDMEDGYKIFYYPNGAVSSEGLMKSGRPEGLWKSYYITGVKKSEGKRTNFLLDSVWVFYDQVGDTTEKINYHLGKKSGWYYKYKKEPATGLYLWSKELYAGDKTEGLGYIYFPDGKIKQTIPYSNGKKEGLSREYDNEGNIITLYEYHNDFIVGRERINRVDDNGLRQGVWKEFYDNGTIKEEKSYRDDMLHGYYKEYDNRGTLVLTMLYDNGSIVKSRVEDENDLEIRDRHDADGRLVYRGAYREDVPVGTHREYGSDGSVTNAYIYNDNGLLVSEGIINEDGNRNGQWKDYYEDGKIKAEGQYNNNRRSGLWKFYNISGNVEQTGYYNNGRPDGLWNWYYDDGELLKEEEYFQGKRDGLCNEYSQEGEIIVNGEYSDGERNGNWFYRSGDITEEGKYIIGLKDGIWKEYFSNGKLKFRGNYIQGNPDGKHIYYYESGKIKEEQYYDMGIRERTWKKYDEEGIPVLTITYRNNTEDTINGVKIKLPEDDVKLIK